MVKVFTITPYKLENCISLVDSSEPSIPTSILKNPITIIVSI
jgi:hypothetical protein